MDNVILIRYGEIHLKGRNKGYFENKLIQNIEHSLTKIKHNFCKKRSRYVVSDYALEDEYKIVEKLKKVFGLHSISIAHSIDSELDKITDLAVSLAKNKKGSFRVNSNRADKTFPLNSLQLSKYIGEKVLLSNDNLSVDLFNPDFTINIDIREDGGTFIYNDVILCAGGMPVGCSGKGLALLSGGIDSPVASYMMAKRGLQLDALHFHSYPYTSELAKQKVIDLAKILTDYTGPIHLVCIPFTHIQEEIHKNCDTSYMIILVRCFMMNIAKRVAKMRKANCIINGESLGQVASQTLESINVTNSFACDLPIFRPLIGMDKEEIIDISKRIGAFETSILPYEDCCTVFLPDAPVTRPTMNKVQAELDKLNVEELIQEAINNLEVIKI